MSQQSIANLIAEEMKSAMRSRNKERLGAIRLIQAAFKQKEVDERIEITDDIALAILNKMVKQRKESLSQFEANNRSDLAEKEIFEINLIKEFLPKELSEEEVEKLVLDAIEESKAQSIKDMKNVMAVLTTKIAGRADMGSVSAKVRTKLQAK